MSTLPTTHRADPADLPAVELEGLVHIGTLDPARKGMSYEGSCLSVSACPEAWEHIAHLGGNPWWACKRLGNQFIDALSLTRHQRDQVEEWAVTHGLAQRVRVWRVRYFDDELDETRSLLVTTEAEARQEAEAIDGDPVPTQALVATDALVGRMGQDPGVDAFDFILCCYAEDHGYDGVFWAESLSPSTLSAPRAGIAPSKIATWTFGRLAGPS